MRRIICLLFGHAYQIPVYDPKGNCVACHCYRCGDRWPK